MQNPNDECFHKQFDLLNIYFAAIINTNIKSGNFFISNNFVGKIAFLLYWNIDLKSSFYFGMFIQFYYINVRTK